MTQAAEGNAINLATMWIPIMPETSHLGSKMREIGGQMHRDMMRGFDEAGGGAENLGGSFGTKFMGGFSKKLGSADFGAITKGLDRLNEQVDSRLAAMLKTKLPALLGEYRRATDEVAAAEQRHTEATNRLTTAKDAQGVPFTVMSGLMRDQSKAHDDLTAATAKQSGAQEQYTGKLNEFHAASAKVISVGNVLGGLVGGALVVGFQALTGAIEGMFHLGEHVFEVAIEGAKELSEKLIEVGEDYANLNVQTVEFSGATGEALGNMQEHVARIFSQLDVSGKNLGQTYAQLSSMLDIKPGAELDALSRKVTDLQGRFQNLKAEDLGAIFRDFKVPAGDFNAALDTLVDNAAHAGEGLGDLSSTLKGKVGETLNQAGISLGNAANLLGEFHKAGIPATDVITGLSTAMSKLVKSGMDFPSAMRETVKELLNSTKAQQDEASATLFGGRRWTEVQPMLEALNRALNDKADAHNGAADAAQREIDKTELLQNKIEKFKHQIEGMLAPFGATFLGGMEGALERLRAWFDRNHTQIIGKLKQWGDEFIDMLPTIQNWGAIFVEVLGAVASAGALVAAGLGQAAGAALIMSGHLQDGLKVWDESAKLAGAALSGELVDKADALADKIRGFKLPLKDMHDGLRDSADAAQALADAEASTNTETDALGQTFARVGPSGFTMPSLGSGGGLPGSGPAIVPAGNTGSFSLPGYDGGGTVGGGGNAEGPMKARIAQLGQHFGLSGVEIREIMGVGKHESNWSGPGYMGFGPEANAVGLNFANNPIGAVDQFFQQFMGRRAAEGDPNDPRAVANYIWHVVHAAADPNYGPELLSASGFEKGGLLAGLFSGILDSLGTVTGGKGGVDDVLIRATEGEMVINKRSTETFRPLLEAINNSKGYKGGGVVGSDSDSGVLQVIWDDTETGAKVGEAAGFGWVGPGTSQPGYYNNDWGGHTGHVHTSFSRNPFTGEPYTQVKAGTDIRQGQAGFPDWVYQLGAQFGLQPSTYPGHQEWGGVNHGIDWWPIGKANMAGTGYTHQDHVMLTNFAGAVGALGAGSPGPGGGGGRSGFSPVDYHGGSGGGGGGGGGGSGPNPFAGGGPGGQFNPSTGLPGLPGQYGGFGAYGGQSYDDLIMKNRAVTHANERVKDLEKQRDKITNEEIPALEGELTAEQNEQARLLPELRDNKKLTTIQREIKDKKDQLDGLTEKIGEAKEDVGMAERHRDEADFKSPEGMKGRGGKGAEFGEAQQLGRGLLSGIAEELGFPDIFGKPIWEFGAFKLLAKGLGIGFSWLNELGDAGGGFGLGGLGGGGLGALGAPGGGDDLKTADPFDLKSVDSGQFPVRPPKTVDRDPAHPDGPGLQITIPHVGPKQEYPKNYTGPPQGHGGPYSGQPAFSSPPGTTHSIVYDHSMTINGVENSKLVTAAANHMDSWDRNKHHVNSFGTYPA